jgi:hypothetical protein
MEKMNRAYRYDQPSEVIHEKLLAEVPELAGAFRSALVRTLLEAKEVFEVSVGKPAPNRDHSPIA